MDIEHIKAQINEDSKNIKTMNDLNLLKANYTGKKGVITNLYTQMKDLTQDEKKTLGKMLNELKEYFEKTYTNIKQTLEQEEIKKQLEKEKIDVTLPKTNIKVGAPSIIEKVIEEVEELFISMGYDVVEGPEVEKDLYNFEMLNLPKGHPARDAQDTFYIKDDELLLRSQTSPVQVRTMLANKEKTHVRIICPGKTYRRDYDDATHSHQFTQIEGLMIDKEISLADLKGTLTILAKKLFGEEVETRFRPSFYPFTEPSVEYDVSCFKCHGKGCNVCKGTSWITIGGAGVVHPNVLNHAGYDSSKYTGFAFGFGVERIAMIKYGINDIRTFYTNDLRNIKEFVKGDE